MNIRAYLIHERPAKKAILWFKLHKALSYI